MKVIINKLDEIEDNTMLIFDDGELEVMTKEDFLESHTYLDKEPCVVSVADKKCAVLTWDDVFENMSTDQHEYWKEYFENSFSEEDWEILNKAKRVIDETAELNPTYFESSNIVYKVV